MTANTHDNIPFKPLVEKIIDEHPKVQIGNINANNAYLSDEY
ncbi:MAG: hypothetical protein ACTSQP_20815 [Promethearchaeota archaeon]